MDFTRIAIEKSRVTAVLLVVILVAGINVYEQMPRDQ